MTEREKQWFVYRCGSAQETTEFLNEHRFRPKDNFRLLADDAGTFFIFYMAYAELTGEPPDEEEDDDEGDEGEDETVGGRDHDDEEDDTDY